NYLINFFLPVQGRARVADTGVAGTGVLGVPIIAPRLITIITRNNLLLPLRFITGS
ncbi:GSCOCG00001598001-RA-CDS, partial [Cotesia congregata]